MPHFSGLPGVRKKKIEGAFANHTPHGFISTLGEYRVATAASDNGSVTVYIDDAGSFRCYFSRRMSETNWLVTKSKAAVRRWLKKELPRMHEGYAAT